MEWVRNSKYADFQTDELQMNTQQLLRGKKEKV
jgi:hypothetical protein